MQVIRKELLGMIIGLRIDEKAKLKKNVFAPRMTGTRTFISPDCRVSTLCSGAVLSLL